MPNFLILKLLFEVRNINTGRLLLKILTKLRLYVEITQSFVKLQKSMVNPMLVEFILTYDFC